MFKFDTKTFARPRQKQHFNRKTLQNGRDISTCSNSVNQLLFDDSENAAALHALATNT